MSRFSTGPYSIPYPKLPNGRAARRKRGLIAGVVFLFPLVLSFGIPNMTIAQRCVAWGLAWLLLLYAIFVLVIWLNERPLFVKLCIAVASTAGLLAIVYSPILSAWRSEQAALNSGILRTIKRGKRDHSNDRPKIQVGNAASMFELGPTGEWLQMSADQISVKRVNGELLLTTTVRDKDGNLIVEVVNNHWTVSTSKTNCWDKNYTEDSLEVKDGRGRVVLQVRVLPDRIQIQGEWHTKNNVVAETGQYDVRDGLNPMFKYPSEKHWGELLY